MFCMYIGTSDFSRERCRLSNLPDLAHEVPWVRDQLVTWLKWMQANFQFDAFRVDAASHMGKVSCWQHTALQQLYALDGCTAS
jgi:glycosidase